MVIVWGSFLHMLDTRVCFYYVLYMHSIMVIMPMHPWKNCFAFTFFSLASLIHRLFVWVWPQRRTSIYELFAFFHRKVNMTQNILYSEKIQKSWLRFTWTEFSWKKKIDLQKTICFFTFSLTFLCTMKLKIDVIWLQLICWS